MKYDPTTLKWGISEGKSDRLIAAFDDQNAATQFQQTLQSSGQYSSKNLQVVNIQTGQPVSELAHQGDRVS